MQQKNRFVEYLKCIANSMKKISFGNLIFPFLFIIVLIMVKGEFSKNEFYYLLIFLLFYALNLIVSITKFFYKKSYRSIFLLASIVLLWSFFAGFGLLKFTFTINKELISINLNYNFPQLVIELGIFLITQRIFYKIWNRFLSPQRMIQVKRFSYQNFVKLKELILAFEISTKKLLVYNLFATLILSYLYVKKIIIFDTQKLISFDALLQTNATIFALMLTITVAILGTNRYIRKIQFTKIVFTGINLFFFMAYLILVIICLIYPNNFLLTLSFFMLVNSVIFMMHLIDNQKIGYILSILNKIIRDNINNKNYNPHVSSTKNTFSWSSIKGTRIETGSYDKFEDFKIAFDSLEELALDSVKNYDKKVFNEIIRNYFELGRYFLYQCGKEDKKYLSVYLFPILKLYNSIESKEYRNEIIELILNDYRCSEQFLDIKTWNLERFKLMTSILIGTSDKEGKKHIASILIKMLTIRMMEKANITYNNFSNQSYKNFKNTDEFKELKKSIKKSKIGLKNIDKLMARFRFEDEKEQKEFNKVIKNIITELKKR